MDEPTKGPYELGPIGHGGRRWISGMNWSEFADVYVQVEGVGCSKGEANARLLAASWDLLAAWQPSRPADLSGPDFLDWVALMLVEQCEFSTGALAVLRLREMAAAGRAACERARGGDR